MLKIQDQLIFRRRPSQAVFEHLLFHIEIDVLDFLIAGVAFHDLLPVGTEDRLVDLVGRPMKGKVAVTTEHQIFQVVADVLVARALQHIVDRCRPEDLRSRRDAPPVSQLKLDPGQFLLQDLGHPVEESPLDGLLKTGTRGAARQLVDLCGRIEAEKLRFEIAVVLPFRPQHVRRFDDRLAVDARRMISVVVERIQNRQDRRRPVKARKGVIAGIDDFRALPHGRHDPPDIVAVGVMAVVVYDQIGVLLQDRLHEFADPLGRSQAAVVLDAEDDIVARHLDDLPHLADIVFIRVLRSRGKADRRLQDPARFPDLLKNGHHVRNVVQKVENPPDVNVARETLNRQPNHVVRVRTVSEQVDAAAESLKQRVRHAPAQHFQLLDGVDLFTQHVHMDRSPPGDLNREKARLVAGLGGKELGVGHDPVLEIGLGKIPLRIRDVISLLFTDLVQNGGSTLRLKIQGCNPFAGHLTGHVHK